MYFFFVPPSLSLSLSLCPYKTASLYRAKHHHASKERERERVIKRERSRVIIKRGRRSKLTRAACIRQKERGVREEALCVFESFVELENFQKRREREKQRHNNTKIHLKVAKDR